MMQKLMKWTLRSGVASLALTAAVLTGLSSEGLCDVGNPNAKPAPAADAQYSEYITELDVPITMRDGTIIYADIYRPKADGKFPVLVDGTPYGKTNAMMLAAGTFVPRATSQGYALLVYDVRGQNSSEGEIDLHINLKDDGYDVVEWAAKQPWSNGRIGVDGGSYDGQVGLNTVLAHPPHLQTGIVAVTAADLYRQWYYRGGALEFEFLAGWTANNFSRRLAPRLFPNEEERQDYLDELSLYPADPAAYANALPVRDFEPAQMGEENYFKEWVDHNLDGEYWWKRNPKTYFHEVTIPVMHLGGWYDIFSAGTIEAWQSIKTQGATALARDNQTLFIGPWDHAEIPWANKKGVDHVGEVNCGDALANYDHAAMRLAYFDYWLKDLQRPGFNPDERVHTWTFNANEWRTQKDYPLPNTEYTKFYLNAETSGSSQALYDGSLSETPPAKEVEPVTYEYDPMKPVATRGGNNLFAIALDPTGTPSAGTTGSMKADEDLIKAVLSQDSRLPSTGSGPEDQIPAEVNTITFTTPVLKDPKELTGHIRAVLYAASDAVDTDWVVRLSDVTPEGKSIIVADGIQRARFRESGITPTLIEPGKIYQYEVDLWQNSWVFEPGHRIRVAVTSSNWPRYSRNMNVAELPELATEWKVANNSIYMDPKHPSHVILPIIPAAK
ncbi:CocE/NonD family hydrolase [uncultured Cohaesibacter sp.]|uniref:CocE/NonD family hydrolase n=1 Tax=uncultured Cohaesibacter sp. TaxID=1002546 RepID=UPI0029315125|nr:CocE/NonD family hydrolase [uncultured Cohaesibacter sp.]